MKNIVFDSVKPICLCKNGFIPPRQDLTSTKVRSHLGGMIFLNVNNFCRAGVIGKPEYGLRPQVCRQMKVEPAGPTRSLGRVSSK